MTSSFRYLLATFAAAMLFAAPARAASTFTSCLGLQNPTPGDPAVTNSWGTIENNGRTLVDSAVAGILTLSVAGNSNVVLTTVAGGVDQARNAHFIFSGVLTGNINIVWPNGNCRMFSVANTTTGAFSVTLGVNNGSGGLAGSGVVIPQGQQYELYSDGTNVLQRVNGVPGSWSIGGLTSGNVVSNTNGQLVDSGLPATAVWSTGDVKMTLKTTPDAGWVIVNDGSIGDASSGGTTRANADASALFSLVWTNCANAQCPVSSGRGGSAAADFSAHKNITLPLMLGRALAVAGSGSGLTARALGSTTGAETFTIAQANLPSVNFALNAFSSTYTTTVSDTRTWLSSDQATNVTFIGASGGAGGVFTDSATGGRSHIQNDAGSITASTTLSSASGSAASGGSGSALSSMQPSTFAINIEIKL